MLVLQATYRVGIVLIEVAQVRFVAAATQGHYISVVFALVPLRGSPKAAAAASFSLLLNDLFFLLERLGSVFSISFLTVFCSKIRL